MTGEKDFSVQALILADQAGKAIVTAQVGLIILSGPVVYLNNGTTWVAMNA